MQLNTGSPGTWAGDISFTNNDADESPFDFSITGTVNALVFDNNNPVATISDHRLGRNEWAQVSDWISYSDADGHPALRYEFWDSGIASRSGYFWTPDNGPHPANTTISIAASDLADVWVRGGQVQGAETMYVRAFDGAEWSEWDSFVFSTQNTPPVATIPDQNLALNEWAQVSSWISYSDANGDTAKRYQFWDDGAESDSGYFWTPRNAHHRAETAITVSAANLDNVWVRGGQVEGAETMWVRAFDGANWGAWDQFNLIT